MHETTWFKDRRSIRAFIGEPLPRDVIAEILHEASLAPSWANNQPWEVVVVSGRPLADLAAANIRCLRENATNNPDLPMPSHDWPLPYGKRIRLLGSELFAAVNIPRDDKEARAAHYERMYRFFDAPHLILLLLDERLVLPYPLFDLGAFVQTLCLAAAGRGIGTCIIAAAARYPEEARRILGLDRAKKIVVGVALGWPDPESVYNKFRSSREPVDVFTTWVE